MDVISMILARNQSSGLPTIELSAETTAEMTTNVGTGVVLNEEEAAFFRNAIDKNNPVCVKISADGMKLNGIFETKVYINNGGIITTALCYDAGTFIFAVIEVDGVLTITMSITS